MLDCYDWEKFISTIAQRADLQIKWGEPDSVPQTDGKTMWIPSFTDASSYDDYMGLRHAVTHESEHVLYSDFDLINKKQVSSDISFLGVIHNACEDVRIEGIGSRIYEGDRQCHSYVHPSRSVKAVKAISKNAPQEMQDKLLPLLAWVNENMVDITTAPSVQREMEAPLSAKGKAYLEKLRAGDYGNVLRNSVDVEDKVEGTAMTYELARRIYEEVFEENADDEEKRCQEESKKKQKGKGDSSEGDKGESDGDETGGVAGKKGEGEPQESEETKGKKPKFIWSDGGLESSDLFRNKSRVGINFEVKSGSGSYIPHKLNEFKITDLTGRSKLSVRHPCTYNELKSKMSKTSPAFANKVRQLLQIRARDRYHYGLKRGKLHNSQLHRIVVDAPGYNERLFKRKEENNVLDACVSLVIDHSGSMSGYKFENAAIAAIMMSDVISNKLHVPVSIIGFTAGDTQTATEITLYRNFNEKLVSNDHLLRCFAKSTEHMSSNLDGEAIAWEYRRLVQQKQKRKLMIVFSDGQPAGSTVHNDDDIVYYTKKVVSEIEKEKRATIVGVGLCSDSVKHFYTNNIVINHANELEHKLLSLIESHLK